MPRERCLLLAVKLDDPTTMEPIGMLRALNRSVKRVLINRIKTRIREMPKLKRELQRSTTT